MSCGHGAELKVQVEYGLFVTSEYMLSSFDVVLFFRFDGAGVLVSSRLVDGAGVLI